MRSIILNEQLKEEIIVSDRDKLHHLNNVIRIKNNEKILILKGDGEKRLYEIVGISKKSIKLISKDKIEKTFVRFNIDILIGATKKDDLNNILSSCVELGISNIFLVKTDYSQKIDYDMDRILRILYSAQEQSNNALTPTVKLIDNLADFDIVDYRKIFVFHPQDIEKSNDTFKTNEKYLIAIGPEGGFSEKEISFFKKMWKSDFIKFETPILRARTAVPAAFGYAYKMILEQ